VYYRTDMYNYSHTSKIRTPSVATFFGVHTEDCPEYSSCKDPPNRGGAQKRKLKNCVRALCDGFRAIRSTTLVPCGTLPALWHPASLVVPCQPCGTLPALSACFSISAAQLNGTSCSALLSTHRESVLSTSCRRACGIRFGRLVVRVAMPYCH
jgi:hypothetical protein